LDNDLGIELIGGRTADYLVISQKRLAEARELSELDLSGISNLMAKTWF